MSVAVHSQHSVEGVEKAEWAVWFGVWRRGYVAYYADIFGSYRPPCLPLVEAFWYWLAGCAGCVAAQVGLRVAVRFQHFVEGGRQLEHCDSGLTVVQGALRLRSG